MLSNQAVSSNQHLVDKPERIGPALAQVIHVDATQDIILGQAWLAAQNQLVTCAHVVEQFASNAAGLFVYFPSSGKRYPVQGIKLHPSFVRQPDGLVKFDAAVLHVALTPPDSLALPLPFTYEASLRVNEPLWTMRYPVHLGQFSAAMHPLSQEGRFLGFLRKHDNFHMLHDVPLAPGDSGAPITDGRVVVAMHCGDTATLPGLNLPTTSIRLALWVDALRELGLAPTRQIYFARAARVMPPLLAFIAAAVIGGTAGMFVFHPPAPPTPAAITHAMAPVQVKFNKALTAYAVDDAIDVKITPAVKSYVFVFMIDPEITLLRLFPKETSQVVNPEDGGVMVDRPWFYPDVPDLHASARELRFFVLSVDAADQSCAAWAQHLWPAATNPAGAFGLTRDQIDPFIKQIKEMEKAHPGQIQTREFHIKGTAKQPNPGK